jgi:hypothetical protein
MLWYGGVVKQLVQICALGLHADRDGMVLQGPIRLGEIIVWFFWYDSQAKSHRNKFLWTILRPADPEDVVYSIGRGSG